MSEFCECGSLVIDGRCTNKNCALRGAAAGTKPSPAKKAASRTKAAAIGSKGLAKPAKAVKATNPRRASKVVTYNLYEQNNDSEIDAAEPES